MTYSPSQFGREYTWRPDLPDVRDYTYRPSLSALMRSVLVPIVDLSPLCSPIEDQGALGSCTANALVGAMEYLGNKNRMPFNNLSRLFLYYNERLMEGTVGTDAGAYLRDGVKSLAKVGCCTEPLWPYDARRFKTVPPVAAYTDAMGRQITAYYRMTTLRQMKACLASGYPFVFGFTVYDSFESDELAHTGVMQMPKRSEHVLGGHAVLAVGYNCSTNRILVRNSWGIDWGMGGYFTMPFAYISDPNLADDFWFITASEAL